MQDRYDEQCHDGGDGEPPSTYRSGEECERPDDPGAALVPCRHERRSEQGRLHQHLRPPPERRRKARDARQRRLLGDSDERGSCVAQRRSDGQQQRARAGDHDAASAHGHPRLHERLRTTNTEDVRKRPPWERKESLSRTRRNDQSLRFDLLRSPRAHDRRDESTRGPRLDVDH